jgi:hypothetical protein
MQLAMGNPAQVLVEVRHHLLEGLTITLPARCQSLGDAVGFRRFHIIRPSFAGAEL